MARESKAELMDRLRREGRFEAFTNRREGLRAAGTLAKQAWYEAAVEFPPPTVVADAPKPSPVDLEALKGKPTVPIDKAAAWVFDCLDADWITPADAPSPGAWSLLHWARTSNATRSDFYRLFAAKFMPTSQERAMQREAESKSSNHAFHQTVKQLLASCKKEDQ